MNEKQKLIRETAQKFEALRPDMQQFVLGYLVARQNQQGGAATMENKDLCKSCQYNTGEFFLYCELQCYGVTKTDGCGTVWKCDDYLPRPADTQK